MANLFARKVSPSSGNKTDSGFDIPYQVLQYFRKLDMTNGKVPPMEYYPDKPNTPENIAFNCNGDHLQYSSSNTYDFYIRIMSGTKPTQQQFDDAINNSMSNYGPSKNRIRPAIDALSDRNCLIEFKMPYDTDTNITIDNVYPHDVIVNFKGGDTLSTVMTSGEATWWYIYAVTPDQYVDNYQTHSRCSSRRYYTYESNYCGSYPNYYTCTKSSSYCNGYTYWYSGNHTSENYGCNSTYGCDVNDKYRQNLGEFVYCIGDVSEDYGDGEITFPNTNLTVGEQFDFDELSFTIPQKISLIF